MTAYVIEELPHKWRYRVTDGPRLVAGSLMYTEFDQVMYGLHERFPGIYVERVEPYVS